MSSGDLNNRSSSNRRRHFTDIGRYGASNNTIKFDQTDNRGNNIINSKQRSNFTAAISRKLRESCKNLPKITSSSGRGGEDANSSRKKKVQDFQLCHYQKESFRSRYLVNQHLFQNVMDSPELVEMDFSGSVGKIVPTEQQQSYHLPNLITSNGGSDLLQHQLQTPHSEMTSILPMGCLVLMPNNVSKVPPGYASSYMTVKCLNDLNNSDLIKIFTTSSQQPGQLKRVTLNNNGPTELTTASESSEKKDGCEDEVCDVHEWMPWFHPTVHRNLSQQLLNLYAKGLDGTFLVRMSSVHGKYVLSYMSKSRVLHQQISTLHMECEEYHKCPHECQKSSGGECEYCLVNSTNSSSNTANKENSNTAETSATSSTTSKASSQGTTNVNKGWWLGRLFRSGSFNRQISFDSSNDDVESGLKDGDKIPTKSSTRTYFTLDDGKTKFHDLIHLIEFYQLNQGFLQTCLSHYISAVNKKDGTLVSSKTVQRHLLLSDPLPQELSMFQPDNSLTLLDQQQYEMGRNESVDSPHLPPLLIPPPHLFNHNLPTQLGRRRQTLPVEGREEEEDNDDQVIVVGGFDNNEEASPPVKQQQSETVYAEIKFVNNKLALVDATAGEANNPVSEAKNLSTEDNTKYEDQPTDLVQPKCDTKISDDEKSNKKKKDKTEKIADDFEDSNDNERKMFVKIKDRDGSISSLDKIRHDSGHVEGQEEEEEEVVENNEQVVAGVCQGVMTSIHNAQHLKHSNQSFIH